MTNRIIASAIAIFILIGLLIWQDKRWQLVNACTSTGRLWNGARSKCHQMPTRIFIEKNLKRS